MLHLHLCIETDGKLLLKKSFSYQYDVVQFNTNGTEVSLECYLVASQNNAVRSQRSNIR